MTESTTVQDYLARFTALEKSFQEVRHLMAVAIQGFKHGEEPPPNLMEKVAEMYQAVNQLQQVSGSVTEQLVQMQSLLQMFSMMNSSLQIDAVLTHVMDTIIDLTMAERAYLMLIDEKTGDLEVKMARNWDRNRISQTDALFSRSVVQSALDTREAVITMNAADDARFQASASVANFVLRSVLCIPLILNDKTVGVLYADNRVMKGLFKTSMIPVLTLFGQQAAIAIANATEFGKVQDDLSQAQLQLQKMEILIDRNKLQGQLEEITDTEFFKKIAEETRSYRNTRHHIKPEDVTGSDT